MTIGKYPAVTAQAARDMVKQLAAEVALGHDPATDKQEAREHKETFGEVAAAYLKAKATELRPRTLVETERYLLESARSLHSRPLVAVTQSEVAELLGKITEDSGKPTANRARANLSALFTWAAKQGKVERPGSVH